MNKKLLVLFLIAALTAFLFVGCLPPGPGPDPDDPDDPIDGVLVEFENSYEEDGRTYVKGGANTITVTFPEPVDGMVAVETSDCTGDYSKASIALFPNADRTVWEGSINFRCGYTTPQGGCNTSCEDVDQPCCATTVAILSGECEANHCIVFPVIVDCEAPTAELWVKAKCCVCEGLELTFKTCTSTPTCAAAEEQCFDECSGVAGWSLNLYCGDDPFKACCEIPCEVPIFTESGTGCPIEFTTSCLDCDPDANGLYTYFAIFSIWDNVGNKKEVGATIEVDTTMDGDVCTTVDSICVEAYDEVADCIDGWETLFIEETCNTQCEQQP